MEEITYRISKSQGYLVMGIAAILDILGIVAIYFDLTGIGAIIEFLITLIVWFAIWLWLKTRKVALLSRKNAKKKVALIVAELIPGIDLVPGYFFTVFLTYRTSRKEDEEEYEKNKQEEERRQLILNQGRIGGRRFSNQKIERTYLEESRARASGERVASRRSRRSKAPGGKEVGDSVTGTYN